MTARCLVCTLCLGIIAGPAPAGTVTSPKAALQPFQDLIGSWRGTGEPNGTREEKQRSFWTETIKWEWQFKGKDAWLRAAVDKGKHWRGAELRYLPEPDVYQLKIFDTAGKSEVFTGKLKDRRLTVERGADPAAAGQRIVVSLLHANRFLLRLEQRPAGRTSYTTAYQIGATKEGVAFATGGGTEKECVVSGGVGTIPVVYQGKTYYVCCSGCRDAFNDDPAKFIKEFEARKAGGK